MLTKYLSSYFWSVVFYNLINWSVIGLGVFLKGGIGHDQGKCPEKMRMRRLFWGHWNCSIVHDVQMVPVIGIIVVAFHFALPSMVMLPSFLAHTMYGMPVCFSCSVRARTTTWLVSRTSSGLGTT